MLIISILKFPNQKYVNFVRRNKCKCYGNIDLMDYAKNTILLYNLHNWFGWAENGKFFQEISKWLTWKHCKFFYRLSTKFKQKYNVYHVSNLKSTVQFPLK